MVLPSQLARLQDLAYNLHWTWSNNTTDLFRRLDPQLWEETNHNPIRTLERLDESRLTALATDQEYLAALAAAAAELDMYQQDPVTWFASTAVPADRARIAYFSMEFGLHECLPIYSGGLGVLAGDHLKSSSDLGLPLVAVGLFYHQGYFQQTLDDSGWQQDGNEDNDPAHLPISPINDAAGNPVTVAVSFLDRTVQIRAWQAQVGRVTLYLLDTDLPENHEEDRQLTARLYGGEINVRIRQEIVLGIGGCRMLEALQVTPDIYHMNEGHAAFLILERARRVIEQEQVDFAEACQRLHNSLVFTTHTPVAAGHDYFSPDLMERHFMNYVPQLGIQMHDLLALGRHNPDDYREYFCMTILALRMAARANGVSRLHGEVSRQQWRGVWPDLAEKEVPIGHITNGVHVPSFLSSEMAGLYQQYMGITPGTAPTDPKIWEAVHQIPDSELWAARNRSRERFLAYLHQRMAEQAERHGQTAFADAFDPHALTIGFARRFATYKRAALLLRDQERLIKILNDAKRPVQFVFAGKAHPRDDGGKLLIQRIVQSSADEQFHHRLIFIEGYDIGVARQLVQGVDVWLNNPQRPYEASGTSGMKASANGALNCSTLDGWWVEAWDEAQERGEDIGWAIGGTETFENAEHQAHIDMESLYILLERELVPAFYERGTDGVPCGWVARMKRSIALIAPFFNTNRMVQDYAEQCYLPALREM